MSDAASSPAPDSQSNSQSGTPEVNDSTLLWTLLEELATTQSYLEVILRNQALIRAKLEERRSEDILGEMEIDQAKVFKFLWPKVIEGMVGREKGNDLDDEGDVTEYPEIGR